jgi:vancomycin permeability regulator SanA
VGFLIGERRGQLNRTHGYQVIGECHTVVVSSSIGQRRVKTWSVVGACLGALVLAVSPTVWTWVVSRNHLYCVDTAPRTPVALVLGAGLRPDGTPSRFLAARLDVAIDLWERGTVGALLVSGDNRYEHYNEPEAMATYLIAHGIPAEVIVADYAGRNTYDSCVRARRIFGVTEAIVVSQAYHLPRAVTTCRSVGVSAIGVGDDTVRRFAFDWGVGQLREVLANIKAVWDLASRRDPVLGQPEPGIQEALEAAGWSR